ncbi:NAD-dependent epimerase/dehydratase family protein [Mesorhizobium sp. M1216]
MTNPQRVLVTGGAGFIGWRCARNLAKDGARVLIADNLSVGMPMPDMDGCETREIDIRDKSGMVELTEGFKPTPLSTWRLFTTFRHASDSAPMRWT